MAGAGVPAGGQPAPVGHRNVIASSLRRAEPGTKAGHGYGVTIAQLGSDHNAFLMMFRLALVP